MAEQRIATRTNLVDFRHAADSAKRWPEFVDQPAEGEAKDHFISRDDKVYAGKHLILDFWGAAELDNPMCMENALRACVKEAGATLLHIHLHRFSPSGGLSGVAVLAESHISVHTWPENDFAAFDIFMCGDADPQKAVDVLKKAFRPESVSVVELLRGTEHER